MAVDAFVFKYASYEKAFVMIIQKGESRIRFLSFFFSFLRL